MSEVIHSLMTFSLYMLRPGGRLVFFLPTEAAKYSEDDVPRMDGLEVVANSEQPFGSWSRRLITMRKNVAARADVALLSGLDRGIQRGTLPLAPDAEKEKAGHYLFNKRYATGFA